MAQQQSRGSGQQAGWYVYGIFPGDIEATGALGVGDPPSEVTVVRSGDLAALVSKVQLNGSLGSPEDLQTHKEILDASVSEAPVLPVKFGAVLSDEDAVKSDLLEANHDEFMAALDELDDLIQYVVKGRYEEDATLVEVLSEDRGAAELGDQIRATADPDATRDARIQLGEIINNAVTAKREADTRLLGERMEGHCEASVVREPSHELDAINVAFLIRESQKDGLQRAVDDLADNWRDRVDLRILGPMAAYDFVVSAQPQT
jgi:hypothetical protein